MKPKMTINEKYDYVLGKLTRKFSDAGSAGVLEPDGFSFDFSIPDDSSDTTLSVQVGANNETQKGYVSGYVYQNGGKTTLEEHEIPYKYDEDFESAVIRIFGLILKQARQYKEELE